jgi:hypothetical protein
VNELWRKELKLVCEVRACVESGKWGKRLGHKLTSTKHRDLEAPCCGYVVYMKTYIHSTVNVCSTLVNAVALFPAC